MPGLSLGLIHPRPPQFTGVRVFAQATDGGERWFVRLPFKACRDRPRPAGYLLIHGPITLSDRESSRARAQSRLRSALILAQQQALPRQPRRGCSAHSLEDSCQAPAKSCGKDLAVWEAVCLAAAGAELPGLACSGGLLAGFAGGRWPAARRVARERAIQRS